MSRMNGYSPSRYTSGAFGSQMNGHGSQSPEQQGRAPASKSSAKALYGTEGVYFFQSSAKHKKKEQRKNYTKNSINSITDTSQYHVEHLTTFVMDRKEAMMTIEDGIRKLKLLDAKGKVWTQDMLLQVDEKAVSLIDGETKSELENFPLAIIQHSQAVLGACRYDSILALVCKESGQGKPDMHLFQCDDIKANLIHADIESAISDHKGGKVKKRPETLRMILKSGGDGVIPPPPAAPAPVVPASAAPVDVKSRVAAWSAWTSNDQQDHERLYSRHGEPPEAVAAKIDRDVQILNHILDDIEYFVTKLQKAAEAFNELSKRKKTKKNKKKGPGEGVLTLRARPPQPDEFIDCFQKFKLAFNLLAKLRSFIQNPSALDLVHFLFTPLNMVVQTTGGVELAKSVVSPLLTREALEFLHSVTTAQEKQLWVSLGDGWIKCRAEWPKDRPVAPYSPCFRSGWQPPALAYGGHSRGTEFNQLGDSVAKADVPRQEEPEHSARSMMQDFPSADGYAFSNSAYKRKHLLDQDTAVAAFKQAVSRHVDRNYEAHGRTQPTNHAKSKFDFVARNSTELSVGKDEIVEVLDDRKQWWKVRNTTGASGYVPNNILEISRAVQMSAGQGGEPVYTHTFQQLLGELNEKQRPDSVPTASAAPTTQTPIPPPSYPAPVRLPSPPPPIATPTTTTTTTPVETRVPAASVSRQSSIACDNGSVTLREVQQKDRPPPVTRRKSNMEEVQDELLHRLTLGRSTQKKLQMPARSGSLSAVNISYDSPPEEVRVWLQIKGFSPFTINSLGMLTGAQLFSLSKDELKTVCPDDGARVYSQVTVQKGALERSSGSELQEIMRRRQEKLNATACDSGVESFDEAGSH